MMSGDNPEARDRTTQGAERDLEARTQFYGREIFRRVRNYESPWRIASRERIEKIVLGWLMNDEELRYRMLRFVDVYPALRTAAGIGLHFEEYLRNPTLGLGLPPTRTMKMARWGAGTRGWTAPFIAWAIRMAVRSVGRQFIAGENPRSVAPRIAALEKRGFAFTLDLLGEFVASESSAREFQGRYREMIEGLGGLLGADRGSEAPRAGPRVNVSIKLSSLTSKFDPMDWDGTASAVLERLRPLCRAARASDTFLNIDMEKFEYRDLTLEILKRLLAEDEFRSMERLGTVIQAYHRDSERVLDSWLEWLAEREQPMTVRLVKGAYWDSEQIWASQKGWPVPVLTEKRRCDAQFERMTKRLLRSGDRIRTAVASHNVRSVARALALGETLGVPANRLEIQMLYGMAGPVAKALRDMGRVVRIYVPCGELVPGMSYLVRRILENTSNSSFLRQRFAEHVDEARLLENPEELAA